MAVYHKYIFRIDEPYTKTAANTTEIAADLADNKKWSDGYIGFKTDIRTYLKTKQNNRCAFCRCRVSVGTGFSNLEHMVGKDPYPQFKFEPLNLVYCCTKCNLGKNTKPTLSAPIADRTAQAFPAQSNGFNIVNPYLDNYEDHLDFLDDIIVIQSNGSVKGANTIEFYKLARFDLAEERAYELNVDQQSINKKLVSRLLDDSLEAETIEQIEAVIAAMPNWVLDN
jgi:uncharacterized protein (TIGR02646 family)